MTRLLVIGYGNPLRGDDGFGPALAAQLHDALQNHTAVEIIACHQLTPELAEPLSRAQRVVFIDAADGGAPGAIAWQDIQTAADAPTQTTAARFTHQLTPPTLLAYAQSLYGAAPAQAFLLTVGGENFGYGESLSASVAAAMPRAHARVRAQLA